MSIFLSTNNTEPYNSLHEQTLATAIEIDAVSGSDVVEHTDILYLIVTNGVYANLELRVENENSSGTSLYISELDILDNPLHWGKLITLTNIDATTSTQIIKFKYKWSVINNIYIVKRLHVSGTVNIYEV